ncbi:MAG: hypothetical protein ACI395_07830, partial [Candidatus Cryptobacteroides sp.]
EKTQEEILSEISVMIADIRRRMDVLAEKLEELEGVSNDAEGSVEEDMPECADGGEDAGEVVGTGTDGPDVGETDAGGLVCGGSLPEDALSDGSEEEPLLTMDDSEEAIELDVPFIDDSKPAVVDVLMRSRAWMNDIPGSSVQDIRSAISLNDRLYFIKNLFSDDPSLFQSVVSELNGYSSFEDAALWLLDRFKGWDQESDVVYRFMMAVRRKLK